MVVSQQIALLNRMIDACINCGGDSGGPYWTDTDDTFEAISDFIFSFPDNLAVQYTPHEEFRVYKLEEED